MSCLRAGKPGSTLRVAKGSAVLSVAGMAALRVVEKCLFIGSPKHYSLVVPIGEMNGANTLFTLPLVLDQTKMEVLVNGISIQPGDWAVSGVTLTITFPVLFPGDLLWVYTWRI